MNRFVLTVMISVMVVAACSNVDADTPGAGLSAGDRASGCDGGLDEAFGAWERAGFSGSIAISTGGEFDCVAGYGWATEDRELTPEDVFSIGSVTKSFTAAAVLSLVEDGELVFGDRVGDHLEVDGPIAGVTVRQLLLHTSGLKGSHGMDHEPLAHDDAIAAIAELELVSDPGCRAVPHRLPEQGCRATAPVA